MAYQKIAKPRTEMTNFSCSNEAPLCLKEIKSTINISQLIKCNVIFQWCKEYLDTLLLSKSTNTTLQVKVLPLEDP